MLVEAGTACQGCRTQHVAAWCAVLLNSGARTDRVAMLVESGNCFWDSKQQREEKGTAVRRRGLSGLWTPNVVPVVCCDARAWVWARTDRGAAAVVWQGARHHLDAGEPCLVLRLLQRVAVDGVRQLVAQHKRQLIISHTCAQRSLSPRRPTVTQPQTFSAGAKRVAWAYPSPCAGCCPCPSSTMTP